MYKKLIVWYLSRDAAPYWVVLFLDTCIVFSSGVLAYAVNHGFSTCVQNLGTLCYTLFVYLFCFWAGFRLFHTYYGITHHTSFTDLIHSGLSLLVGVILIMLLRVLFHADTLFLIIRFRDLLLQTLFATIGMCGLRIAVKVLYDQYIRLHPSSGAYGWNDQTLLDMEMKDLLPREPIRTDLTTARTKFQGKRILVTGAAGSIGSELVKQLAVCRPRLLLLIDQAETPLHHLQCCLKREWPQVECHVVVTSICHSHRMEHLFKLYKPEMVFHAAAYKHVPMMEENPEESVLNNVDGTRKLAVLAAKYRVDKFILISTDKAVNPTNVMGCSKRICEIFCQSLSQSKKSNGCKFITTRFGNVLGSNGSVIPIFREQIRRGGPLTVTHPDIKRYFMLIPEACQLVLKAAAMGKGGEIFVFDMGNPVRIADLAKRMIELSGNRRIKIEYVGLRPGEKLYEDLLEKEEKILFDSKEKIKVAKVRAYDFEEVDKQVNELIETALTYNAVETVRMMKRMVPEYVTHINH